MIKFKLLENSSSDQVAAFVPKLERRQKLYNQLDDTRFENFHSPYIVDVSLNELELTATDKKTLVAILNKHGTGRLEQDDLDNYKLRVDSSDGAIQIANDDRGKVFNIGFMKPCRVAKVSTFVPRSDAMKFVGNADNDETKRVLSKIAESIKANAADKPVYGLKTYCVDRGGYEKEEIARRVGEMLNAVSYKETA